MTDAVLIPLCMFALLLLVLITLFLCVMNANIAAVYEDVYELRCEQAARAGDPPPNRRR